jgi:hypothetical protein
MISTAVDEKHRALSSPDFMARAETPDEAWTDQTVKVASKTTPPQWCWDARSTAKRLAMHYDVLMATSLQKIVVTGLGVSIALPPLGVQYFCHSPDNR